VVLDAKRQDTTRVNDALVASQLWSPEARFEFWHSDKRTNRNGPHLLKPNSP